MDPLRPEVIVPASRRPRLLVAAFTILLLAPMLALVGVHSVPRPARGIHVSIDTDPPGANVRLGGIDLYPVTTPCRIFVPAGLSDAKLRLSRPGYRDAVVRLAPGAGDADVRAVLLPY